MRVVIIGNGVAATSAATTIRQFDTESSITMVSDEDAPFYSRPRLIEYLAGKTGFEKIIIHDRPWYEKNGIELVTGANVHSVQPKQREILGSFGALRYDRLLVASGASPTLPDFFAPGLDNVFTLRTKLDADTIITAAAKASDATVIGGGLLGIETANALAERGLTSTIVEFFDRLLPRQLDTEAATILQAMLEAKGLRILLGKKTKSLSSLGDRIEAKFADETGLAADMAVISAGVQPNIVFLRGTGIELRRGIIVDERMQTSLPSIFAAGDCAEYRGTLYGIWPAAKEQGEVAGAAIAGQEVSYSGSLMSARLKVAGIDVASIGDIAVNPQTREESWREAAAFKKLFYENGRLRGAILIGAAVSEQVRLQKEMALPALH